MTPALPTAPPRQSRDLAGPRPPGDTPPGGAPRRHPALDGLRGVAVLGVLAFHTDLFPGGFLGVDLFLVLSGYLITGLLLRELRATGTVSLPRFWARRLRRLLPACAVMLVAVTVTVWTLGRGGLVPADLVRTTLDDGPWVQLNLVNWHLLAEQAGYWDRFGQERVFEHLWSIAVEEQFYLAWPLLVLALGRLARPLRDSRDPSTGSDGSARSAARLVHALRGPDRLVPLVAVVGALASLTLMVAFLGHDPSRVHTGTDTRAFSLLLGAAGAAPAVRERLARVPARWAGLGAAVLAAGIAVLWLSADGTSSPWLFTGGLFAHAGAAALLIALCAEFPRSMPAVVLAWRPLRWLGGVSYALYLWHWPVVVLLSREVTGLDGWWWTTAVWGVSIAVAAASTSLVENPIRFRAGWARGRRGAAALVAVTVGVALLWFLPDPPPVEIDLSTLT